MERGFGWAATCGGLFGGSGLHTRSGTHTSSMQSCYNNGELGGPIDDHWAPALQQGGRWSTSAEEAVVELQGSGHRPALYDVLSTHEEFKMLRQQAEARRQITSSAPSNER